MDSFALQTLREQFPVLDQKVKGRPLAYLDNAATSQKPWFVLRAMQTYYQHDNANIHRAVHILSQRSTEAFDQARNRLQRYVNANRREEIIFTKGVTEAINLVANSWGLTNLTDGDVVLLSTMEHHANIVPWQMVAQRTGAKIIPIPIADSGEIDLAAYAELLKSHPVKMVGVVHISNSLGTINPVAEMVRMAHDAGSLILVDGAQSLAHGSVDVRAIGCDFMTFSGHKTFGPTGVGALYGRFELLDAMPPYQGGGDMIRTVTFEESTYAELPNKFEPGTPNIAGIIGWGAALEWLEGLDSAAIHQHERDLHAYAEDRLRGVAGLRIIGTAADKAPITSFVLDAAHPHDVGTILDSVGVAVRTGHHCCQPLMRRFAIPGTTRASFALYNSREDVDQLILGLERVLEVFA